MGASGGISITTASTASRLQAVVRKVLRRSISTASTASTAYFFRGGGGGGIYNRAFRPPLHPPRLAAIRERGGRAVEAVVGAAAQQFPYDRLFI
jgi:hypothetical protein